MKKLLSIILITCSLFASSITTDEASNYIGKKKKVCGKVVSTFYAKHSNGSPTFLNIDRPYPNDIFTVVIFGKNRDNFENDPENYYKYKNICVYGKIFEHKGVHQINLRNKSQMR